MTWALVTGAAARGGAAIARELHAAGIDIVIHHTPHSRSLACALGAELDATRPNSSRLWEADFITAISVPRWIVELAPQHCICNASAYRPSDVGDVARATDDLAVHVLAHASILAALRPSLRSVVAVGDIHVERPARGYVWYTVSKAALQALMLSLAVDWAPEVRCNVVAPGALQFPEGWDNIDRERAVRESIPLARLGGFAELARAVKWLTVDAEYVTGQVLAVDGGRSRWLA
jgi:pteridine reductase